MQSSEEYNSQNKVSIIALSCRALFADVNPFLDSSSSSSAKRGIKDFDKEYKTLYFSTWEFIPERAFFVDLPKLYV